jgi:putative transposase
MSQKPNSRQIKLRSFDFGLKTFLTCSDGSKIESPQFLKQSLNAIKKASRQHSKKRKGSANLERARLNLVRKHEDVTNRRSDWFWKLAHELTNRFDVLCFETLNLKGMQRLWGPKISDESIRGIPENPRMGSNLEREASRLYRQMVSEF